MFLIERRAAAVLAALATAGAVAVLPELWDRVGTIAISASPLLSRNSQSRPSVLGCHAALEVYREDNAYGNGDRGVSGCL
jgi:hypothetical protein